MKVKGLGLAPEPLYFFKGLHSSSAFYATSLRLFYCGLHFFLEKKRPKK